MTIKPKELRETKAKVKNDCLSMNLFPFPQYPHTDISKNNPKQLTPKMASRDFFKDSVSFIKCVSVEGREVASAHQKIHGG